MNVAPPGNYDGCYLGKEYCVWTSNTILGHNWSDISSEDTTAKMSQESATDLFVLGLKANDMVWKKEYFNKKVHQMREKAILCGENAECYICFWSTD